ncbi:MAG TPA: hypothetical protein VF229_05550 [Burkholderiaceae bacterium]
MNGRFRLYLVGAIAAFMGLAAGIGVTTPVVMNFAARGAEHGIITGVNTKVEVLSALRGGRTEQAIASLESALDGDLLSLRPHLVRNNDLLEDALRAARGAAAYRSGVSYRASSAEVGEAVERVLRGAMVGAGYEPAR